MKRELQKHLRGKWYYALFFAAVLITLYMNVYMSGTLLDGDASDHIYRAYTSVQNHDFFNKDYYYTTEYNVFGLSFFFAPFFWITSNWRLVRILGTCLMQALYILSFFYLSAQLKVGKAAKWVTAALMLLPFSTVYARLVQYDLLCIMFITYSFLLFGLILRLALHPCSARKKDLLPFLALAMLSVIVGLNGVRIMMVLLAPMLVTAAYEIIMVLKRYRPAEWKQQGSAVLKKHTEFRLAGVTLLSCLFFMVGFLVNQNVFTKIFHFTNSSVACFSTISAERLAAIINGFFISIGVRSSMLTIVSKRGISFLCALFGFGYIFFISFRQCFGAKSSSLSLTKKIPYSFFLVSFLMTSVLFVFVTGANYEGYYIFAMVMAFPVIAAELERAADANETIATRLLAFLLCACFVFQGVYTNAFLRSRENGYLDQWCGLAYQLVYTTDIIKECVSFMQENGYTHAMTPYWYANTMIEFSDATVIAAPYAMNEDGTLRIYKWATSASAFDREKLPEEIIVWTEDEALPRLTRAYPEAELVFAIGLLTGYQIPTDQLFP